MNPEYQLDARKAAYWYNKVTTKWEITRIPPGVADQAIYDADLRIDKDPLDPDKGTIPCTIFKVPDHPKSPVAPSLAGTLWAQASPPKIHDESEPEENDPQVQTASMIKRIAARLANLTN